MEVGWLRWLILLVIVIGNVGLTAVVNKLFPLVLGMPFFLFWLLLWMVLSPFLTWLIYALDNRTGRI